MRGGTSERVDVMQGEIFGNLFFGSSMTGDNCEISAKIAVHLIVWICAIAMAAEAYTKFRDAVPSGHENVFHVSKIFLSLAVITPGLVVLQTLRLVYVWMVKQETEQEAAYKSAHCYIALLAIFTSVASVAFGATFTAYTLSMTGSVDELQRYSIAALVLCCLGTSIVVKYGTLPMLTEPKHKFAAMPTSVRGQ